MYQGQALPNGSPSAMSAADPAPRPLPNPVPAFQKLHAAISEFLTKDLFFIGAHPKSGTTWLQTMLNAHPEISCRGEGHFVNHLAPLLASALKAHNRLITTKNQSIFDGFPPFPAFDQEHHGYLLGASIALMLLQSGDLQRVRVIGEKTPDNIRHFAELAALFPQARFVHMVRDGRDCAVSAWFHNLRINPGELQRRYRSLDQFVPEVAASWKAYLQSGTQFGVAQPDRCMVVRYESLVASPRDTLRGVLRFLGVDATLSTVRHCVAAGAFETMSGGRPPGVEDRSSFLRRGMPGNWRDHLSPQGNRAFLAVAGEAMAQLGYQT